MSVGSTEAVSGYFGTNTPTTGTTAAGSSSNAADKDMFLKLLVAQMKYQDPTNPTDSSEFLSQSAQFTSLEKMQVVADQTTQLLGAQMAFGASSMVGRTVSYTPSAEDAPAVTGQVRGVTFGSTGPMLDVDGVKVPITSLLGVTDGSSTAAAAPAPSTASTSTTATATA